MLSGRVIAQTEGEVRFVVGSGRLGIAYLIERDGFLFQSPIAWYRREQALGPATRLREVKPAFRPADPVRMPVLPCQPFRAGGGNG